MWNRHVYRFFYKAGFKVSGIDISPDLLRKAQARTGENSNVKLVVADIDSLPYEDNTFDAVVGICVLHHLDVKTALKEIMRVLKKGGIIIFSEPNMMNPQLMIQKNIKPIKKLAFLGETEDETAFFRWQLASILKEMGFKGISIKPFDFLHPWTPKPMVKSVEKIGNVLENTPFLREISGSLFMQAVK
jgi:ubiquinone/menaquinone biosynthesis C-methylase UbiE